MLKNLTKRTVPFVRFSFTHSEDRKNEDVSIPTFPYRGEGGSGGNKKVKCSIHNSPLTEEGSKPVAEGDFEHPVVAFKAEIGRPCERSEQSAPGVAGVDDSLSSASK